MFPFLLMIFRKGVRNRRNMHFTYKDDRLEIVHSKFVFIFTDDGASHTRYVALPGQASTVSCLYIWYLELHKLDMFDK